MAKGQPRHDARVGHGSPGAVDELREATRQAHEALADLRRQHRQVESDREDFARQVKALSEEVQRLIEGGIRAHIQVVVERRVAHFHRSVDKILPQYLDKHARDIKETFDRFYDELMTVLGIIDGEKMETRMEEAWALAIEKAARAGPPVRRRMQAALKAVRASGGAETATVLLAQASLVEPPPPKP